MLTLQLLMLLGCIFLPQIISQEMPEPIARIQVRSDPSGNNQYCSDAIDGAERIRDLIQEEVFSAYRENRYGLVREAPATSCAELQRRDSSLPSGYYWVVDLVVESSLVWCDMELTCGPNNVTGWTRIAFINMSDPNVTCPGTNYVEVSDPIRYCRRSSLGYACDEHRFNDVTVPYSRVCGRVIGIQIGTGDVFRSLNDINHPYVDGVSLTYGNPRQHIWTFISYTSEFYNDCPCSTNSPRTTPDFVGEDYFCESGAQTHDVVGTQAYTDDPLWDGQLCRETEVPCCDRPPWFYKELGSTVNDTIDFRLCSDQGGTDEESAFQLVELYVQ